MTGNDLACVIKKGKKFKIRKLRPKSSHLGHINNQALESIHVLGVIIHLDNLLILKTIFHL